MPRRHWWIALAAVIALTGAACGRDTEPEPTGIAATPAAGDDFFDDAAVAEVETELEPEED